MLWTLENWAVSVNCKTLAYLPAPSATLVLILHASPHAPFQGEPDFLLGGHLCFSHLTSYSKSSQSCMSLLLTPSALFPSSSSMTLCFILHSPWQWHFSPTSFALIPKYRASSHVSSLSDAFLLVS